MHEWQMSACFVLALAATLAPMLVLFGLKFGVVNSMAERLIQDPRNREIKPVGSGHFSPQWFNSMRERYDVAFITPRTRNIAATMSFQNIHTTPSQIIRAELIPTGPGDPLLRNPTKIPRGDHSIVLSDSAAQKLRVSAGDKVNGSITRVFRGNKERVQLELGVIAVADPAAFGRDGAFVSLDLLVAVEDFRDGRAVQRFNWTGDSSKDSIRTFPGFRLYARSIYDVLELRDDLQTEGLEVRTRSADIEIVQSLDRNLSIIFWVIAAVALSGYSLSLGTSLWANVDRKRRELSVLRLVGFRTGSIVWFPVLQATFTGLLGWSLACLIYISVEQGLNQLFQSGLEFGESVCRLLPVHFLWASIFTLVSCMVASALGGLQASRIEPSEGVREI